MVQMVKPTQVTLVPDAPDAITSNAGWDCKENAAFLYDLVARFHEAGVEFPFLSVPIFQTLKPPQKQAPIELNYTQNLMINDLLSIPKRQ